MFAYAAATQPPDIPIETHIANLIEEGKAVAAAAILGGLLARPNLDNNLNGFAADSPTAAVTAAPPATPIPIPIRSWRPT